MRREAIQQRPVFKLYQAVVDIVQEDPGLSSHQLRRKVKAKVENQENSKCLAHSTSLARRTGHFRMTAGHLRSGQPPSPVCLSRY
jgi:hypothetical protein